MKLFRFLGWMLIIIGAMSLVMMLRLSYQDTLDLIIRISGYNKPERIASLLTENKYLMLQFSPILGIVLGTLIVIFSKFLGRKFNTLLYWIQCIWVFVKDSVVELPKTERILLWSVLFIGLGIKAYLAFTFPITYDEAWTYVNFTQKSIVSSISYYPAPNNHIFFSVLTNLFALLPVKLEMVLRLPVLLAQTFFLFLFYIFSRKLFDYKVSLVLLTICSFLFPVLYYGFVGRGYIFVLLFFVINYFILVKIITGNAGDIPKNMFLYALAAVFGFYTMPSYLYPYATLTLFMMIWAIMNKDGKMVLRIIGWGVFTVMLVLILYTPVFVISGVKSVVANGYVQPMPRGQVATKLFPFFADTFELFFYYRFTFFVAIGICLLALINKPYRKVAALNLFILIFALCIPIMHSVIAFSRTWIYLIVPVLFSLGILLDYLLAARVVHVGIVLPVLLILMFVELGGSYKRVLKEERMSLQAVDMNQYLLRNRIRSVYIQEPLTDAYVLFTFKANRTAVTAFIHEEELNDSTNNVEAMIYQRAKEPELLPLKPVYQNDFVAVYENPAVKHRKKR